jgi:hypothetical protein
LFAQEDTAAAADDDDNDNDAAVSASGVLQVMVGICYLCSVWGEPLAQTAQSFMPAFIHGNDRNLKQVNLILNARSHGLEVFCFVLGFFLICFYFFWDEMNLLGL